MILRGFFTGYNAQHSAVEVLGTKQHLSIQFSIHMLWIYLLTMINLKLLIVLN